MNDFIEYARQEMEAAGYKMELIDDDKVFVPNTTVSCSGFFDKDLKLIRVATRKPADIWLGIFVHEFCHFLQEIEQDPSMVNCYFNGKAADECMDAWFENKQEYAIDELEDIFEKVKAVELDCEKRSVEMIKKYNLPIDTNFYIQMANAYVLSHNLMMKKRQFIRAISTVPEVKLLPTYFLSDYKTNEHDPILEALF